AEPGHARVRLCLFPKPGMRSLAVSSGRPEYSRRRQQPMQARTMTRFATALAGAVLCAAIAILAAGGACVAADYPARTVTLVVPYPPGGGVDAMARVVA